MPALLERSVAARCAVVFACGLAIVGLAQAAVAGDDLGLRRIAFWPEQLFAPTPVAAPPAAAAVAVVRHRGPRRIWAADRTRPLRISLARGRRRTRLALHRRALRQTRMADGAGRAGSSRWPVSPKLLMLPKPDRPALVSIYQDRTLRDGDAVMMADGVHMFRGAAAWPHRGSDFVRLQSAASLGWSLRHTLSDLDRAPPDRWSTFGTTAG